MRESCVSRNIVALEQLLDMQLFDRDVHGVRLTEAGRAWTDLVRAHYEGLHDALAGGGRGDQDAKTVKIGLCGQIGRAFVARLVDRFRSLHPDVSIAIEDVPHEQGMAAIRRRRLDIVFTHGIENGALCRSELFGHERMFVLLPGGHPLAERPAVRWRDLTETCLLISVGSPQDPVLLEKIAADGGPAIQMCRASEATVILKIQLGLGATLAGEGFARTVAIDATVWKPIDGENSISSIKAVWLESNPKRALLRLVGTARNMVTATRLEATPSQARNSTSGRRD